MIDVNQLVQAGTIALLLWAFRTLLEISKRLAVHEEKHRQHDERLKDLETKPACPYHPQP